MNAVQQAMVLSVLLFFGILLGIEVGRRVGDRHHARDPEKFGRGTGAVEAAVFSLLGLLLAFTFSGAAERFEQRRHLIVDETNIIGTTYLRLDMLPADHQPALRDLFRRYVEARIQAYQLADDQPAAMAELARANTISADIWRKTVVALKTPEGGPATVVMLNSLNEMIDIATTRTAALSMHPPKTIILLLATLTLACSVLAGYGMGGLRHRSRLHIIGFAIITAMTIYFIEDLEYPRQGIIKVDSFDRLLQDARDQMD